ncbi:hypothetical protein QCF18_10125 [Staphylococcus aureus]|nr:hypothetical protein [Staphylococcus aureus]YP_008873679.1 hypothetical protein X920_gp025 [Staphylococcus phage Sb1]YP_009098348.1 hypothetical protein QLX38_gp037 [Staphylococcus phage Team1]YP_009780189.1 hypothetical protein QLX23_gp128 [Staphylococcus phage ISP]YP_009780388.1 hypothetical protein QLX37_gp116 [Staphylococcus phage SA5]YP_009782233.1 hypothetical protein QLX43_gp074 [Staphylococcus phage IME-SA1]YP_009782478.1 hypothetical protein QLX44_gp034 [Staphylococcus phage IME-S
MISIEHDYTIRTVDNRKYTYYSKYESLVTLYENIMSKDCIEVTKYGKDKKVIIDTRHIVSIERW